MVSIPRISDSATDIRRRLVRYARAVTTSSLIWTLTIASAVSLVPTAGATELSEPGTEHQGSVVNSSTIGVRATQTTPPGETLGVVVEPNGVKSWLVKQALLDVAGIIRGAAKVAGDWL